jgi:hypothetical protein
MIRLFTIRCVNIESSYALCTHPDSTSLVLEPISTQVSSHLSFGDRPKLLTWLSRGTWTDMSRTDTDF